MACTGRSSRKNHKERSQVYIVGKIKTRSYVDKDGVNKYITEILADTLLLLEKKQSAGTTPSQPDSQKGDAHEKGFQGSAVNEPPASYNPVNDSNSKNWSDKGAAPGDDFQSDIRPDSAQNEDDLPF